MKYPSKAGHQLSAVSRRMKQQLLTAGALVFLLIPLVSEPAQASQDLFSVVPAGDKTYSELQQLAKAGWVSEGDLAPSLTRYDVVRLIQKAEQKREELVVADDNMEIPPPPDEIGTNSAAEVNATATPMTQTAAQQEAARAEAIKSIHSLEAAYQFELKLVKDKVKSIQDQADQVDSDQYDLRKRLKGTHQYPTVAVHGIGRVFGLSQQYSGSYSGVTFTQPGNRFTLGYLDFGPQGTVSKEIRWNAIFRAATNFLADSTNFNITVRRVTMEFNPAWLSAKVGDFDEAYTPLMLWNRDSLDLAYKPEMWARQDDEAKYEGFLNHEPYWPFRGLRVSTDLMWPDSDAVRELKASTFVHMIRNGFQDTIGGGWYFGPDQFTDWVWGGNIGVKSPKWYLGSTSLQASIDTYGLLMDEPLDTQQPGSPYGPFNPSTWAHQYILGSVKPDVKVGLGDDVYVGGTMEYANSSYQDDKLNSARVLTDFALLGGPYIQFGNSKITLNYLNVGPYFYSPLAQTRQDAVTAVTGNFTYLVQPDIFQPPLRTQYFLTSLPRAGGIYSFYDRTQDNTFPYGLATPNRQGFGGELDVKTLEKDSLKIKGAVYFAQEISGNLVVNTGGTGFIPVDSPTGTAILPLRNFVYVNLGPTFNLGPYIGFDRDLEIGTNVRFEQTNSDLGTLTSTWLIGGVRADILPAWEVAAAYSWRNATGTEAGYNGTLWARYPYLYDNSDLSFYTPVTANETIQSVRLSSSIKVNRNSSLFADYDWTTGTGNLMPINPIQGNLNNQFVEVTYEVQF